MGTPSNGVHLVGSMPTASADETFALAAKYVAPYLRRSPDGEPGERQGWVSFQSNAFGADGEPFKMTWAGFGAKTADISPSEAAEQVQSLKAADTHYDTSAIESFAAFDKARQAGAIPVQTKFQVSLPTIAAAMMIRFKPEYRAALESRYTDGLQNAVRNILQAIPHESLSIQFDLAMEISILEGLHRPWWVGEIREGLVHRITELATWVPSDVELGFHLCYGDHKHKHFKEPEDAGLLNDLAVELLHRVQRPVQFIHLPVPIARKDAAYFAPLAELQKKRGDTEIYLGLVHPDGVERTKERMRAAREVIDPSGVSTECGMGRTPKGDIESIMTTMAAVCKAN